MGMVVPWSLPGALFSTLSLLNILPSEVTLLILIPRGQLNGPTLGARHCVNKGFIPLS